MSSTDGTVSGSSSITSKLTAASWLSKRGRGVVRERAMIDQTVLHQQYAGVERLTARQSLWRLRAGPALHTIVLDRATLGGIETILDVGCGSGTYLAELRRRGHTGMIVGLDQSAAMVRRANAHASTAVANAQALPLADDSVLLSIVIASALLAFAADAGRVHGVVRPGRRGGGRWGCASAGRSAFRGRARRGWGSRSWPW
jgi:SAM-dependent methyltransferase